MNVCTVILGAGKGSRMKSITPKPFHKVANLKLIDWVLKTHNSIQIDKKIIVTSKDIDFSELCITSQAHVDYTDKDTTVITQKAKGIKCPVCWKISESPCPRHS